MSKPNSFDERASTWDEDPSKVARADAVAVAIRGAVDLTDRPRTLEYGAGTGLLTQALRDTLGPVTLADTSSGMLEVLRTKVASGVIPDAEVRELDLATEPAPDERFGLITSLMTLHHIPDVRPVLQGFAQLLDEGGHLCIVDLVEEDGSFHGADFSGHDGFDLGELEVWLRSAGFVDVSFDTVYRMTKRDREYDLFLVVCRR